MPKTIAHVVGARPNFIKAAPVIHNIEKLSGDIQQILIHTGQHYDKNLSEVFFNALKMPKPDVNLKIGSSRMQAKQVADVMIGIEEFLANGGVITKVPPGKGPKHENKTTYTSNNNIINTRSK